MSDFYVTDCNYLLFIISFWASLIPDSRILSAEVVSLYYNYFCARQDNEYVYGVINLITLRPHRKNPNIANVFSQMGIVEELGSGIKKMFKYTPLYSNGNNPQIEEQDVYRITIPIEPIDINKEKSKEKIYLLIKDNPYITTVMLMEQTGLSESSIYKIVRVLRECGAIHRMGGDNGGYWACDE